MLRLIMRSENKRSFFIFTIIMMILAGCISCEKSRMPLTGEDFFPSSIITPLKPDPDVVAGELPNGFRYILMKNSEPKDRVSLHLNVQAGSVNELDEQQGLAHYLEHMMFNGTKHFKPGELVKYFQSIGMDFGGDANAHTGFYETVYDMLLPQGDRSNLEKGLLVMHDYASEALLLESEVERERKVILAEKRTRDSASYRTFVSTLNFELNGMKIVERFPIGTEETLMNANRALLKDYYDTWYRPEKMMIVAVGDFDPAALSLMIEEKFGGLKSRASSRPVPFEGAFDHDGIKAFHHYEEEDGNTSVNIEVLRKINPPEDSEELQKYLLKKNIADEIIQNRLDSLTGKPGTPFTSASVGSGIFLRYVDYAVIASDCSPEKWEESLSLIEKTLRQALEFGFSTQELERVKKEYISELEKNVKTMATRSSDALARRIISSVNGGRIFQSPIQRNELLVPVIKALTISEIHEAFKDSWSKDHRLVIVTGNAEIKEEGFTPEEKIRKVFEQSQEIKVTKHEDLKEIPFPYFSKPLSEGKISESRTISDLGIKTYDFQNGLRLNLKQTDFKDDEVLFRMTFGGGKYTEPEDKPGLSLLASQVVNESGVGMLDKEALKNALAGKNVNISFLINEDSFILQGSSTSEDSGLLIKLLFAYANDMSFREDAYELAMNRFRQKFSSMERSVDGVMGASGDKFLASGDSRFGLPEFETFRKNSLEDVKKWITAGLKEGSFELSVVGDFEEKEIVGTVKDYLGTLPPRLVQKQGKRNTVIKFPSGKNKKISVKTEIPKGIVKVTWQTDDFWNIKQTRRLSILGAVFSERLRKFVREELGAAYSPYAFNNPSTAYEGYGVFQAVVTIDPKDSSAVENALKEIAESISEGVTDEELKLSVGPVLTSIKDMRRKNRYWLASVLSGLKKYPEKLEWSRTILRDYESIKAHEISNLAEKYLKIGKSSTVEVLPE